MVVMLFPILMVTSLEFPLNAFAAIEMTLYFFPLVEIAAGMVIDLAEVVAGSVYSTVDHKQSSLC